MRWSRRAFHRRHRVPLKYIFLSVFNPVSGTVGFYISNGNKKAVLS